MSLNNSEKGAFTCASNGMHQPGLTKREYMATQIMAGLAAAPEMSCDPRDVAICAVALADALLEVLNE